MRTDKLRGPGGEEQVSHIKFGVSCTYHVIHRAVLWTQHLSPAGVATKPPGSQYSPIANPGKTAPSNSFFFDITIE